ncbi:MAG: hypothetical protein QW560_02180 [Candidatus Nitrosocaldus sp.]
MDRILSLLKDYYARECRMNRMYCSILQRVSTHNGNDSMLAMVMNYLMLDTYKNVTVLGEMLPKFKSIHHIASDVKRSIPININQDDILNLLSTILHIEKDLNQNMVYDYTEFYKEESSSDDDSNNGCSAPNGNDEQFKLPIKSILRCISIDIEERLNMLSSLTSAVYTTIFCACGYELPRIASIDVQHGGCTCRSQKESRLIMMITIHCPRCGRVHHSMVGHSNGASDCREARDDINCYS